MDGNITRHARLKLTLCCLAAVVLVAGRPAHAQSNCAPIQASLIIDHAGSLSAAFTAVEKLFTQQTGACIDEQPRCQAGSQMPYGTQDGGAASTACNCSNSVAPALAAPCSNAR